MATVRRLYIYLISAISLQSLTWALIALARNLLIQALQPPKTTIAFEIAVVIIGLPIFLVHWLWGQRLARQELVEREAGLRRFYLYASLAGFLSPIMANAFNLLSALFGESRDYMFNVYLSGSDLFFFHLIPALILSVLLVYHQRVLTGDLQTTPNRGANASSERFFRFGFSAAGLTLTCLGAIHLLRGLLFMLPDDPGSIHSVQYDPLAVANARALVGLATWLFFWNWSQHLFEAPESAEGASVLRKFYLYGAVFAGVLGTVGYATTILAGILRRTLGLAPQGDLRIPIPIILVMGLVWAYHAYVLKQDQRRVKEAPRQASIRRIYLYLVAGVGLGALLIGLGGIISVLLRAIDQSLGSNLREQLAWFSAAVLAGLPVWLVYWRQAQHLAVTAGEAGEDERTSLVRKIYLYFYIFAATLTVLGSLVYIAYRIFSLMLGEPAPRLSELGQAIAYCAIAVGVWLYHGSSLRGDNQLVQARRNARLRDFKVLLLDHGGDGLFAALLDALHKTLPDLSVELVQIKESAEGEPSPARRIQQASLAILPWTALLESEGGLLHEYVVALKESHLPRLLLPVPSSGWEWAGIEHLETPVLVQQTLHAVQQVIAGQEIRPSRPLSAGAVVGIVIAGLIGFVILMSVISLIVENF